MPVDEPAGSDGGSIDLNTLTVLWGERWPRCRPVGDELRACAWDRWVRFHSLPGSKRYADNEAEYREVLSRHNRLIHDLADGTKDGRGGSLLLVFPKWPSPRGISADPTELVPDGVYWFSIDCEDEGSRMDLYVCRVLFPSERLDAIFRNVADDVLAGVIICDLDLTWLYHPYDGGCDVITSTPEEGDLLRQRYSSWLSSHPQGL